MFANLLQALRVAGDVARPLPFCHAAFAASNLVFAVLSQLPFASLESAMVPAFFAVLSPQTLHLHSANLLVFVVFARLGGIVLRKLRNSWMSTALADLQNECCLLEKAA